MEAFEPVVGRTCGAFPTSYEQVGPPLLTRYSAWADMDTANQCVGTIDTCRPWSDCGLAPQGRFAVAVASHVLGRIQYTLELSSRPQPVVEPGGCSMAQIREAQELCRTRCELASGCATSHGIHECRLDEAGYRAVCALEDPSGAPLSWSFLGTDVGRVLCNDGDLSPTCRCGAASLGGCCSWHDGIAGCFQ
jgi:hypothetical protein